MPWPTWAAYTPHPYEPYTPHSYQHMPLTPIWICMPLTTISNIPFTPTSIDPSLLSACTPHSYQHIPLTPVSLECFKTDFPKLIHQKDILGSHLDLNCVAMDRHWLILWERDARGLRTISRTPGSQNSNKEMQSPSKSGTPNYIMERTHRCPTLARYKNC